MAISSKYSFKLIAAVLVISAVFVLYRKAPENTNVQYNKEGFSPKIVTINKGDVVTFINSSGLSFWPASDLHPSHLVYPEFDSKSALPSGQSWSFEFNKIGKWAFHDHLDPTKIGTVVVKGFPGSLLAQRVSQKIGDIFILIKGENEFVTKKIAECSTGLSFESGRQCWERAIGDVDKIFGTNAAFDFLQKASSLDPQIQGTCHYYSEYIGFLAYERFFRGQKPEIYKSADICGYGFYHAFLQELVSHTKDISQAYEYCEGLDYGGSGSFGKENCIQGMGIGLVFMNAGVYYGMDDIIVNLSASECGKFFSKDSEIADICINGVFSGLAHLYFGDHGIYLDLKKEDPFWVCRNFDISLQRECYPALSEVVYYSGGEDINKTVNHISAIKDDIARRLTAEKLGIAIYSSGYFKGRQHSPLFVCKFPDTEVSESCFDGYIKRYIAVEVRALEGKLKEEVCEIPDLPDYRKKTCN